MSSVCPHSSSQGGNCHPHIPDENVGTGQVHAETPRSGTRFQALSASWGLKWATQSPQAGRGQMGKMMIKITQSVWCHEKYEASHRPRGTASWSFRGACVMPAEQGDRPRRGQKGHGWAQADAKRPWSLERVGGGLHQLCTFSRPQGGLWFILEQGWTLRALWLLCGV